MFKNKILNKKTLKLLLRISISFIFIAFLLHTSNINDTFESLGKANHLILVLGIGVYILGQVVSSYKWKLLAEGVGFQNKFREYVNYYFTGMFFNLFLPTTVGGDVAKCYYLSKSDSKKRKAPAIYSVLAERFTGVAVIAWLGTLGMLFLYKDIVPFNIIIFMAVFSLTIALFTPFFPSLMMFFFKKKKWVRTMLRDIKPYWNNPKLVFRALYWSFFFHLLIIEIHIIIGNAMGLNIPVMYYFVVYPMAAMAGFIPLAFNGIGPREGTYVYFLSLIGIKQSSALAFGIFWFGIVLISSLIGGIFYVKGKYATPPDEEFEFISEEEDSVLTHISDTAAILCHHRKDWKPMTVRSTSIIPEKTDKFQVSN